MSVIPMNGGGPGIAPGGTTQEDPQLGVNALMRAIRVMAENAAGDSSAAEAKDHGQAALYFAQALVILDPSLSQGGTPLEHDMALAQIQGQTQAQVAAIQADATKHVANVQANTQLRQAREAAAAPTPSRKLSVSRDGSGRMTGIHQEG
jgi:hypothetical protein